MFIAATLHYTVRSLFSFTRTYLYDTLFFYTSANRRYPEELMILYGLIRPVAYCWFVFGARAPIGPGPPHSRGVYFTLSDASQSVGPLWTSDQFFEETQNTQQTNIHAPSGIRTHNQSRRAAADLRLRPRGQWDRSQFHITT